MPTQVEIDRKRRMAEFLMSQQAPQGGQAGRFYVAPSPFAQIASGGANVAGAFMGRQADKQQGEFDTSRKAELAETMRTLSGAGGGKGGVNPGMAASLAAISGMPIDQQEAAVAQMATGMMKPEAPIKLGANDRLVDPNTFEPLVSGAPQTPKSTDDIREYEFAKSQGFPGSFEDYMLAQRKAGSTSVNVKSEGTIPAGFRAVRDDQGNLMRYEPVEGGPAATEAANVAAAAENLQQGKEMQGDIVTQEIDRALATLESPSLPEAGFVGNVLKGLPGTDAHAVQNFIGTVKANIGFDKLQAMREASPNGSALGNVTEREIDFLQSVIGSLEQSQSKEDLTYNLNRVWNTYQDIVHGPNGGPPRRDLAVPQAQPAAAGLAMPDFSGMSDEELKRLASGG